MGRTVLKFRVNKQTASKVIDGAVAAGKVTAQGVEVATAISSARRQAREDDIRRKIEIGKAGAELLGEFASALKSD